MLCVCWFAPQSFMLCSLHHQIVICLGWIVSIGKTSLFGSVFNLPCTFLPSVGVIPLKKMSERGGVYWKDLSPDKWHNQADGSAVNVSLCSQVNTGGWFLLRLHRVKHRVEICFCLCRAAWRHKVGISSGMFKAICLNSRLAFICKTAYCTDASFTSFVNLFSICMWPRQSQLSGLVICILYFLFLPLLPYLIWQDLKSVIMSP